VAVGVIATNLIDFKLAGARIALLNANLDSSWSHVATAAALAAGAAVAVSGVRGGRQRAFWAAIAAALVLLFVIEVSPAHVQVDRLSWGKLIYVPLLACLAISLARLARRSEHDHITRLALGLLAASYGVHVLGPHVVRALGWGTDSWAYQVKVGVKEGAELAGWLLLVIALWRMGPRASRRRSSEIAGSPAQPTAAPRRPVRRRIEASPMGYRQTEQS